MITEMLLMVSLAGLITTFPVLMYNEYVSYIEGHRHVTYGMAILFFVGSIVPVVNVVLLGLALWSIFGRRIGGILSKPMIRETK